MKQQRWTNSHDSHERFVTTLMQLFGRTRPMPCAGRNHHKPHQCQKKWTPIVVVNPSNHPTTDVQKGCVAMTSRRAFDLAVKDSQSDKNLKNNIVHPWRRHQGQRKQADSASDQNNWVDTVTADKVDTRSGHSSHSACAPNEEESAETESDRRPVAPAGRETLLKECRGLLEFLWRTSDAFDSDFLQGPSFDECFDFGAATEVCHVVHGKTAGKWGEVESSWLRVELKGMNGLDEGTVTDSVGIRSYHGTRWPKLPWILSKRRLTGGPREAGGKNGVWTSPVFRTAEMYAWPEPLGSAGPPYFDPWQNLAESQCDERFQAVLELDVYERRKHSTHVYVTLNASKAVLKAVHLRCWREGADDHAALAHGYFPSSFMPNGARLWYVASSEPKCVQSDSDDVDGNLGKVLKKPKKTLPRKKRPNSDSKAEQNEPKEAAAPEAVQMNGKEIALPSLDRRLVVWEAIEKQVSDADLRNKLHKFLTRTYESAVRSAAEKLEEMPGTFLSCWAEAAIPRLVQAAWENKMLRQPSTCKEIVATMKLMLESGLVPKALDASPARCWTSNLEAQLKRLVGSKLKEGSSGQAGSLAPESWDMLRLFASQKGPFMTSLSWDVMGTFPIFLRELASGVLGVNIFQDTARRTLGVSMLQFALFKKFYCINIKFSWFSIRCNTWGASFCWFSATENFATQTRISRDSL